MITITLTGSTSFARNFYLYKIEQGEFELVNEFARSDANSLSYYLRADASCDRILTYSGTERKANIYHRTGINLNDIQPEFNPHLVTAMSQVQMSDNGDFINFGTSTILISYKWNGTGYNSFFNNTITATSYRAISPDGLYLVIGEAATLSLRVFDNLNPTLQKTNINLGTGVGSISWIGVGKPGPGIYDILCRYILSGVDYATHILFNTTTNGLTPANPIPFANPDPPFATNWAYKFFITTNGKYVLIVYRLLIRLYEKQSGQYVQVYNDTKVSANGRVIFVSNDASLIVITPNDNSRINLLFNCDVQKCLKCKWINLCQVCDSGYVLSGNACVCPEGTFNLSGTCINCSISNCVACTAKNVCSSCGNGYSLVNNTCMCPSTRNISQTTQRCVTCNVVNCYRCSSDDMCEVFFPVILNPTNATNNSAQNNQTINSSAANNLLNGANLLSKVEKTSQSVERIESIVIVLAVVIGLMLVGMIMIGLVLAKLMKNVPSSASVRPEALHEEAFSGQKNETSSILKEESQLNLHQHMSELPSDITGKVQEQLPTEFTQSQKYSNSIVNLSMSNEAMVKCKERKRRKFNQLNTDFKNEVSHSQPLDFSVSIDSTQVIDLG